MNSTPMVLYIGFIPWVIRKGTLVIRYAFNMLTFKVYLS